MDGGAATVMALLLDTLDEELTDHVDWAERTCDQLTLPSELEADLRRRASVVRRRLADPSLYIAVVGEFNSGKSTFVNTLLRDRLLPTAAVVTTAVATEIRSARRLGVAFRPAGCTRVRQLRPSDGRSVSATFLHELRRISPSVAPSSVREAITALVADPVLAAGVETVTIGHPAALLGRDVVIVDTPGVNATDDGHAAVVDRVVAESADLAVVLVPANSQVSRVLAEFLGGTLARHLDRCLFVVTKLDQVPEGQRDVVLRAVRKRLELAGVVEPQIFSCGGDEVLTQLVDGGPVDEFGRRFVELEKALAERARQEHALAVSTSATNLVTDLLDAATASVREHRDRIAAAERELDGLRVRDLDGFLAAARTSVHRDLRTARGALRTGFDQSARNRGAALATELDKLVGGCDSTEAVKRLVEHTAPDTVKKAASDWLVAGQREAMRGLGRATELGLQRVDRDFSDEYRHLAKLAGRTAAKLDVPRTQRAATPVVVEVDFGAASRVAASAVSTENWSAGGGAAVGAIIGSLVAPGIGTLVGGWLGAALGAGAANQLDKARSSVRKPLGDGARAALERARELLRDAVDKACAAEERRVDRVLAALKSTAAGPVGEFLAAERKQRDALGRARTLAEEAERAAAARVEQLADRRRRLTELRGGAS